MSSRGGVIDEFFIALGFRPDSSGLKSFQRQAESAKESILSIGTALSAFAAGFAVKEIAKIGSDFEQTRIQIAGFFTALGQSTNFDTALGDADEALQMIASAAAKLPGEAEEYQQVFTDTFSFVKGAVGGSIKEMTDFTNTLTAIGKAGRLDAGQIARETDELLSAGKGRAATRNRLWMQLLPLMRHLEGQAHLTSEQFNAMTETKRADLMKRAFSGLKPMLDASANSFDAMWGAMVSGAKKLVRLGTAGLFDRMKKALAGLNAMFFDSDFNLTALGQSVVDAGKKIVRIIGNVVDFGAAIVKWFAKSETATKALKGGIVLLGIALAALAFEKVAGSVGRLLGGLLNLKRLLTGGLFLAIYLVAEDLYVFEQGGKSVTGMLVNKFGPAAKYISEVVLVALGTALAWVNREAIKTAASLAATALRPLLPLILIAGAIYGVVKLWQRFGEKGRAAMVFVGTAAAALFLYLKRSAIQTAFGLFLMNLPLILIIGTLALLALGIYEAIKHWHEFGAGAKVAVAVAATAIGTLIAGLIAAKAEAIGAAVRMAFAWLASLGPIALVIVSVAAIAAGIYLIIAYWDQVTDAIWNAVDAVGKFLHLSDDASGRKELKARREKSDAQMSTLGDGTFDKTKRGAGNDGVSTDFLRKKKPKGEQPAAPPPGGIDFMAFAKNLTKNGTAAIGDIMPGGMPKLPAGMMDGIMAGAGGLGEMGAAMPTAAMDGARAGAGGAAAGATVNNYVTNVTVPAINVTGAHDPEATARVVRRELDRASRNTTRTGQTRGPAL